MYNHRAQDVKTEGRIVCTGQEGKEKGIVYFNKEHGVDNLGHENLHISFKQKSNSLVRRRHWSETS